MGINNAVQPLHGELDKFEIGIIKNKNTDVIFSNFPDNLLSFDNMTNISPYQLFPKTGFHSSTKSPFSKNLLDEKDWRDDFCKPIQCIIDDANNKRSLLYSILVKNPSFPWHKSQSKWVTSLYYSIMIRLTDVPVFGGLLVSLASIFIGFPLFLVNIAQYFFFYLLDWLFCRLTVCRGSQKERSFVEEVIREHPSLDTTAIDQEIVQKVKDLTSKLSAKFGPQLRLECKVESQQVVDERNADFYVRDSFLIVVETISSSSFHTEDVSMV